MFFYILGFSLLSFSSLIFWDRFLCNWFSAFLLSLMYAFHIRNCYPNPQAQLQWNPLWFDYIHALITYNTYYTIRSDQISRSVMSNSLRPHESQNARPRCPSPTPRVHSDSRPSSQWCHPAISSSVVPFSSCPQSLPASETFPMSQLFAWGGQSTGVSALASFLPKKS